MAKKHELRARVVHAVSSAEAAFALPPLARAQMAFGAEVLAGNKTLGTFLDWLEANHETVLHLNLVEEKTVRYDALILGGREVGVFFDHAAHEPNGIVMKDGEVHDTRKHPRPTIVAQVNDAMMAFRRRHRDRPAGKR